MLDLPAVAASMLHRSHGALPLNWMAGSPDSASQAQRKPLPEACGLHTSDSAGTSATEAASFVLVYTWGAEPNWNHKTATGGAHWAELMSTGLYCARLAHALQPT